MVLLGCTPSPSSSEPADVLQAAPTASTVPLRVWVIGSISEPQILMRQWLANSEQPLELRSLTAAELLGESQCGCDVVVYPARLVGELNQREWIVKLPAAAMPSSTAAQSDDSTGNTTAVEAQPAAWRMQAEYAAQTMAVSLGCSVPVFVASASLGNESDSEDARPNTEMDWPSLLAELNISRQASPQLQFDIAEVDAEALVDRYLAIVASVAQRDPGYGLLFDLQTMQPRLHQPEFLEAAELLAALASQVGGQAAAVGSHSVAWKWASENPAPALAIASPSLLDTSIAGGTSGKILRIRAQGAAPSSKTSHWNTGGGLMASLSSNCRQTNQAVSFLKWVASADTRAVLAKLIPGVESATPVGGADSLSWKARQSLGEFLSRITISQEPRMPGASRYRKALTDELTWFLSGQKNSSQALADAEKSWNEITTSLGKNQRRSYEESLGLTL